MGGLADWWQEVLHPHPHIDKESLRYWLHREYIDRLNRGEHAHAMRSLRSYNESTDSV